MLDVPYCFGLGTLIDWPPDCSSDVGRGMGILLWFYARKCTLDSSGSRTVAEWLLDCPSNVGRQIVASCFDT